MGERVLVALLNLSSWCLLMVERLFLVVPRGCLRFVNVVFPYHTQLLFLTVNKTEYRSKRNPTGKPWCADKQPKHLAPTILSIDKSYLRIIIESEVRRAIKEESKVANRDWVDI